MMTEELATANTDTASNDAASVQSDFNDIVTSIEQFREHAGTLEQRLVQQKQAGQEALCRSRATVAHLVQQCVEVLHNWQQQLCAEVTGITSVHMTEVLERLHQIRSCKQVLDQAMVKVQTCTQSPLSTSDMVQLSIGLQDQVDPAAGTVLQIDQRPCLAWPEVSLVCGGDSFPAMLSKLSSRALGHVPPAVHVRDALQGGLLTRQGVAREQAKVCRQGDWITMTLQVSGDVSSASVVPYLSCTVTVSGDTVPCKVYCTLDGGSAGTIALSLQSPPCQGFGALAISIHCFLRDVPGSPLLLTLQGGTSSCQSPPPSIASPATTVLPLTDHLDGAQHGCGRSILCGCICGGLLSGTGGHRGASAATAGCDGKCMLEITQKEGFNGIALEDNIVSTDSEHEAGVHTAKSDMDVNTSTEAINWNNICTDKDDLRSFLNTDDGTAAKDNEISSTPTTGILSTGNVVMTGTTGVATDPIKSSLPMQQFKSGCSTIVNPTVLHKYNSPRNRSTESDKNSSGAELSLELTNGDRRTLDMCDDIKPDSSDTPNSFFVSAAKKMREGFPSSPGDLSGNSTQSADCDQHSRHSPVVFDLSPSSGVRGARGAMPTRRAPGPAGPLRRPKPDTVRTITQKIRSSDATSSGTDLETVQGGDFLSLVGSNPPISANQSIDATNDAALLNSTRNDLYSQFSPKYSDIDTYMATDLSVIPVQHLQSAPTNVNMDSSSGYPTSVGSATLFNNFEGASASNLSRTDCGTDASLTTQMCITEQEVPADRAPIDEALPLEVSTDCGPDDNTRDTTLEVLGADPGSLSSENLSEMVQNHLSGTCVRVYGDRSNVAFAGDAAATNSATLQLKSPIGIMQLQDGSVIVCDTFNDRLVKYSEDGTAVRIFNSTPPLLKPSAVVLLTVSDEEVPQTAADDDEAVFAVRDHNAIYVFNGQCRQLRTLARKQLRRPYGLTVDDDGQLVTVETGVGVMPTITRVHPESGVMTRVPFNIATGMAAGSVSKPRFIAYHKKQVLIVVDLGLDVVAMVSMTDGTMIRRFGSTGHKPGQFMDPSGVVCDADGYIILGDSRNHRIQVFSPTGEFLSVLRVDRPLRRPSGLCLTPCGHLLVLNYWENTVVKYRLTV